MLTPPELVSPVSGGLSIIGEEVAERLLEP